MKNTKLNTRNLVTHSLRDALKSAGFVTAAKREVIRLQKAHRHLYVNRHGIKKLR